MATSVSKWREVFEHHLGPRWRLHATNIVFQLDCLNQGLKPGLLWDVGPPLSRARFLSLVERMRRYELLAPSIHVIFIGNDHLLADLGGFLARHLAGYREHSSQSNPSMNLANQSEERNIPSLSNPSMNQANQSEERNIPSQSNPSMNQANQSEERNNPSQSDPADEQAVQSEYFDFSRNVEIDQLIPTTTKFIDVSNYNVSPVEITTSSESYMRIEVMLKTITEKILKHLRDSQSTCLELEVESTFCVPTLFGLFVGYPVVYWYNQSDAVLSHVAARVYKVMVDRASEDRRFELYSFSAAIDSAVAECVQEWWEALKKRWREAGSGEIVLETAEVVLKEMIL